MSSNSARLNFFKRLVRWMRLHLFSSLTRRIVFLNVAALAAFVAGVLYMNQFQKGLIDARVESLLTQGQIISGAIAQVTPTRRRALNLDPDEILRQRALAQNAPKAKRYGRFDFPINPVHVAPILRQLIQPTRTRARVFDLDGRLLLDSRFLFLGRRMLQDDPARFNLPEETWWSKLSTSFRTWMRNADQVVDNENSFNGLNFIEVDMARSGSPASLVRVSKRGELIVSVAVPIERERAVRAVLLLSTEGGDIDAIVFAERLGIVRLFFVAVVIIIILSVLMAGTIAGPVRRLAAAADRVRLGVKSREEIPDFGERHDEIGELAHGLRQMTVALYDRIAAIEGFAADVAHELKNPLTSLRSAVETLPLAKKEGDREKLLGIIQHDITRLDRLISDISDASRVDAEMARSDTDAVDLRDLLETLIAISNSAERTDGVDVDLGCADERSEVDYIVNGVAHRLGQVFNNLIDNALSFSPPGSSILVALFKEGEQIIIHVEDKGPGIEEGLAEKIFDRFYTDRPDTDGFGDHSGLGLSISKQIIDAHKGEIYVETGDGPGTGARFVVRLPDAAPKAKSRRGKKT